MKNLLTRIRLYFSVRRVERVRAERLQRVLAAHPRHGAMVFGTRRQAGFTLIELLISIAIVAILAGTAAYAYSGLSHNAEVSEANRMLDGAQQVVSADYQSTGTVPGNAAEAGINQNPGKYVSAINAGGAGQVWATFNAVDPALSGLTLTMTPYNTSADPSSPLLWVCGNAPVPAGAVAPPADAAGIGNPAPPTTVPPSYLPRSCRP